MVKAEFRYFSRGTDLQKLATAKRTNGFLADNQIWEAQGPWFSEIYVCKSPQGGGGFRYLARGLLRATHRKTQAITSSSFKWHSPLLCFYYPVCVLVVALGIDNLGGDSVLFRHIRILQG